MPAAAVIPAPVAYIYIAAFKKLVVGCKTRGGGRPALVAPADARAQRAGRGPVRT